MSLLEKCRESMSVCTRCSACKFIPLEQVSGYQYAQVCPSIAKYQFHTYSAGGRLPLGVSLLEERIQPNESLRDIVYNCQMCGACDVSCKYGLDMDVLQPLREIRNELVEQGCTHPALDAAAAQLRKFGCMQKEGGGARWYDGLELKDADNEPCQVVYIPGCRTAADPSLWPSARAFISLMQKAGKTVGIFRDHPVCCGGRVCEMGYNETFRSNAQNVRTRLDNCRAEAVVTTCAECFHGFSVLFSQYGLPLELPVLHAVSYLEELIKDNILRATVPSELTVTYHDPCSLGRKGEPFIPWEGEMRDKHRRVYDPPRTFMRGTHGIYDAPRAILNAIPGVNLQEMVRYKEFAWCCGAGGGVRETNLEFGQWTADERLREAQDTGARVLVTACPGCLKQLSEAAERAGEEIEVLDVVQLLDRAVGSEVQE